MSIEGKPVFQVLGNPAIIYPDGEQFGWRDITAQVSVRGVGATDPDWVQIAASPFFAYRFAVGDMAWFAFHIPHDIVPGADIHLHAHWLSDGASENAVSWEWTYMYARGFNQDNFNVNGTVITATEAGAGSAYRHMVTETTGINIPGLTEPDGIIYVRLRRVTNGGTENTNGIFLLTSDVHYRTTDMSTIGKAPNFYQG